jgi:hypothetical protein
MQMRIRERRGRQVFAAVCRSALGDVPGSTVPNGLHRIEVNGKSRYVDKAGKYVINPQFNDSADFSLSLSGRQRSGLKCRVNRQDRAICMERTRAKTDRKVAYLCSANADSRTPRTPAFAAIAGRLSGTGQVTPFPMRLRHQALRLLRPQVGERPRARHLVCAWRLWPGLLSSQRQGTGG